MTKRTWIYKTVEDDDSTYFRIEEPNAHGKPGLTKRVGFSDSEEDARLIATSPLLLEACEAIAYDMQAVKDGENIALDKVRAAIRVAK